MINKNTIEEFKEDDKTALIQSFGEQLWTHIQNYTAVENPSLLAAFFVLSFAVSIRFKSGLRNSNFHIYVSGFKKVQILLLVWIPDK